MGYDLDPVVRGMGGLLLIGRGRVVVNWGVLLFIGEGGLLLNWCWFLLIGGIALNWWEGCCQFWGCCYLGADGWVAEKAPVD